MPPGKDYIAYGENVGFEKYLSEFAKATGARTSYKEITFDDMVADTADRDCGIEVAWMFVYSVDPGYDGGMDVLTAEDMRKVSCVSSSKSAWSLWAQEETTI